MRGSLSALMVVAGACSSCTAAAPSDRDPGPADIPAADQPAADSAATDAPDTPTAPPPFQEYPWATVPAQVQGFLCDDAADPLAAPDKTYPHCRLEGADFTGGATAPVKDALVIWAYNLERGQRMDDILQRFSDVLAGTAPEPVPDVILASELDRGCPRSGLRNVARDLAEALGMYYVFAVEFVELENDPDGVHQRALCEHGNALLSRYPLGNVSAARFERQLSWYKGPEVPGANEPRLGGRVAVVADVKVGNVARLHAVALHLESGGDGSERSAQAAESAVAALAQPLPSVLGGDLNTGFYFADLQGLTEEPLDPTVPELTSRGFVDAHLSIPGDQRVTDPGSGFVLDLIFGHEVAFAAPGIGGLDRWEGLSDHLPVWATASF